MNFFKREKKPLCPLIERACIQERCTLWQHITGQDPQQAGKTIDMHDCALRWNAVLLIEQNRQVSQLHASINQLRNTLGIPKAG